METGNENTNRVLAAEEALRNARRPFEHMDIYCVECTRNKRGVVLCREHERELWKVVAPR